MTVSLERFRDSRRWYENIYSQLGFDGEDPTPGYVYLGVWWIEQRQEDVFWTMCHNQQREGDLEVVEDWLFDRLYGPYS